MPTHLSIPRTEEVGRTGCEEIWTDFGLGQVRLDNVKIC